MADTYDIVVAGAGHNSLVAAAYLAKAGFKCLVLEGRPVIGGDTMTEELTLPGFKHDSCSSAHVLIQSSPTLRNDELKLGEYGLEYIFPDPVVHIPFPDGTWITQWRDLERTCDEFAKFSKKDAEAYRHIIADYDAVKHIFSAASYTPVGFGKPLNDRLAEHPDGKLWQRRVAQSAWDIIRDNFEDEHTRAFMLWIAFMTVVPPEQPMTGRLAYSLVNGRQNWSWTVPKCGSGELPKALARLIETYGGTILTDKWIKSLIIEDGKCVGVECADGGGAVAGAAGRAASDRSAAATTAAEVAVDSAGALAGLAAADQAAAAGAPAGDPFTMRDGNDTKKRIPHDRPADRGAAARRVFVQPVCVAGGSDQGAVGAGAESAAAAQRPHPEPRRNGARLRAARGGRLQRRRRGAIAAAGRPHARRHYRSGQ